MGMSDDDDLAMGAAAARLPVDLAGIFDPEPLDTYQGRLLDSIRQQIAAGDDVLDVTAAIAESNNALTRQLLELAEARLGPPPCRYAWLVLGSQGRGEQVLSSDQDSAIAFDGAGADDESAVRQYFAALSDLVVTALARAGLPLCSGGYMATSWCLPLEDFRSQFRGWIDDPQPLALLQAEVFLDVQACHGELAVDDLEHLLLAGGRLGPFRAQMARAAVTFTPPLSWLGRVRTQNSVLDVKRSGTAAIVLLARLYALAAGSSAHSTVRRLQSTVGTLNTSDADGLVEAYRFLTELRLRHQLEQIGQGRPADNWVRPDGMTDDERRRLRSALHRVRDIQAVTATRFATHTVT